MVKPPLWNSAGVSLKEGSWHYCYKSTSPPKKLGFTELHLQNPVLLKSPGSQAFQSFLTRQISQCYFTTVLQPRVMLLGTCGSDFATAGLKEIQIISSVTHSTEQNTQVFNSASVFLDVEISDP